ncbi:MAG: RNA pseudouridine synthase [Bacilli bacterium]|nr:RNA pseudouridine synthase [Bacilli bacterium]
MINVLYEDNHIIVVEKKVGVLSQGDATKDKDLLTMVKEYVKGKYHKPGNVYIGLVHRLDRMVGGIMVFARTSKAASRLSEDIRTGLFHKEYIAIVNGKIDKSGTFKDKIKRLDNGNSIISDDGAEAILNYEVLDYIEGNSLVKINLITGRHHQIRVQFASRGHAILGDHRYSDTTDNLPLALYAYKLEFTHPVKKVPMKFELYPVNIGYFKKCHF